MIRNHLNLFYKFNYTMTDLVIVQKTGELKEINVKSLKLSDLYKKCGFRKTDGFSLRHTWKSKLNEEVVWVSVFSRDSGNANTENKYDLPPPVDTTLYFGNLALVAHSEAVCDDNNLVDLTTKDWNVVYEKLFGGFEDLNEEESFSEDIYEDLLPHHDFYLKKDISESTLIFFKSGLSMGGKMYQRYVFPIINEHGEIHGLSGRDLSTKKDSNRPKWKHIGKTSNWIYPLYLRNKQDISPTKKSISEEKEVIIVESIGDCVNLFENGFKNCLVSFGLNISPKLVCSLTELNPSKIVISFNNDKASEENRGQIAAIKNYCKLLSFFDYSKIQICLPLKKDFGDMETEDFNLWKEKKEQMDQSELRRQIKVRAKNLFENKKLSKALYSKLKILPIDE